MKRIIVVSLAIVLILIPLIGVNCGSDGATDIRVTINSEFVLDKVKAGPEEVLINSNKGNAIEFTTPSEYTFDVKLKSVAFVIDSKLWVID